MCEKTCRSISALLCLRNARGVIGMNPQETLDNVAWDKVEVIDCPKIPYALH